MLCFEVGQILFEEYAVIDFKHGHLHCGWSDNAPVSPKRILNVHLSYLPKNTELFYRFRKIRTLFKF